ncbi:hypothetical protein ASG36_06310 [Geodermatophilus sp. Leaf369]|uniref:hypothetical protein n=1 Tax=Geodermatophilus sp. Leaf369 TaxID=1736354 RepID=UPI0006F5AE98|nr:hypothetical protein [Geodermatophilus sp. Leaf369]KQS60518.1 hypothetical protein ASG36_06310 [Geodermatophilus sp. Leaf369]QNG37397.1 hypothetical protein F1C76_13110 [Geodermatophilaceae bacterium NBWT11]
MRRPEVDPHPSPTDPVGASRLATTCLRALADLGRPVELRELLARLNPRPAQGDREEWSSRHRALLDAVGELRRAQLIDVYTEAHGSRAVVQLADRDDVHQRAWG